MKNGKFDLFIGLYGSNFYNRNTLKPSYTFDKLEVNFQCREPLPLVVLYNFIRPFNGYIWMDIGITVLVTPIILIFVMKAFVRLTKRDGICHIRVRWLSFLWEMMANLLRQCKFFGLLQIRKHT